MPTDQISENSHASNTVYHTFPPVYSPNSRYLILGSFPSVKSRSVGFYYGNPQNRFWKLVEMLFGGCVPDTIPGHINWLNEHDIALWDVISSCEINGSSDLSIRNPQPADLRVILENANIHAILCNGKTAGELFIKYRPIEFTEIPFHILPSTSPANAAFNLERLREKWEEVLSLYR